MVKAAAATTASRRAALLVWGAALLHLAAAAQNDVCPYDGGWSLRVKSRYCPSSAPIDCGTGTQRRCCPAGYVCAGVGLQGGSWCCKEGEDCSNQAREIPRCPNQQWTLWGGDTGTISDGAWCCEPGFNGFYRGKVEGVGCTDAGVNTLPGNTFFAKTVSTSQCATATPTSSSPSSATAAPPTTTPAADGQTAGSSDEDDGKGGLGSGAIAGIVVGCVAGIALVAGIIGATMWRRRRHSQAAAAAGAQDMHDGSSPGGYATNAYGQQQTTEMGYAPDSSAGGYSGSTAGGGGGYYDPSPSDPQMKENTIYSPPAELHNEHRHLIGDQRAESHEMP
ncbi:hypothetical protein PG993_005645 [Apiospora rasikravindrae]|uniref:Uncharacterized protein n=1 Tax=Apiospora rasikravindrae TaxID=990691 RepID=A0ABR1TI25_9PEZI